MNLWIEVNNFSVMWPQSPLESMTKNNIYQTHLCFFVFPLLLNLSWSSCLVFVQLMARRSLWKEDTIPAEEEEEPISCSLQQIQEEDGDEKEEWEELWEDGGGGRREGWAHIDFPQIFTKHSLRCAMSCMSLAAAATPAATTAAAAAGRPNNQLL